MSVTVADSAENAKACICASCSTFIESRLSGLLFCARGKAIESVRQKTCICPYCAVWKNNKLKDQYYCAVGKSSDI